MRHNRQLIILLIALIACKVQGQDTFSIVAVDSVTGEVGSAGASCVDLVNFPGFSDDFLGELFPGVGAINTQAWYVQSNQANARNRMNLGDTPVQIIDWLVDNDVANKPELRQYGIAAIIDGFPEAAAHTGSSTDDYKNHIIGPDYSIQGNILLGKEVLELMEAGFLDADGDLACKLMAALQGANMIGADKRCSPEGTSSLFAFLKVAQQDDVFGDPSCILSVRTADGDGIEPIDSLQTLFDGIYNCTVVGLKDSECIESDFAIYPNPVRNIITVEDRGIELYRLEIVNIAGSVLYHTSFQDYLKIDVSMLQSGIYFVRLWNSNQSYVTKMIKN